MIQGFKDPDKNIYHTRRRTILYLIQKYLNEYGYRDIATTLKSDALLNEYEICDNIDIDIIFLEYCSYQQLKFGKIPNILKKIPSVEKLKQNDNKGKKIAKNVQKTIVEVTNELPLQDYISDSLSVKQFDNQNSNKLFNFNNQITSNHELPEEWKQFSDIIMRTILTKNSKFRFKNIIGNEDAITIIKEAVILPLENPLLFENELKPWKSLLLYGPPGCGKTLIAKALCSEIQDNMPFFNITSSTIISKWRGDSEKILNTLFVMARNMAPSIIFFDEIECLTNERHTLYEHESSHRLKSEFLTLLDGIHDSNDNIFILANTNVPWLIDDAFLRRFEKKILIKLPTANEREELFNYYLEDSKNWSNHEMEEIKILSNGFTGDEIRISCKESKMQAIRKLLKKNNTNIKLKGGIESKTGADAQSLAQILRSMTPNSNKQYEKHYQWQKEKGCANQKN